MVLRNLLGSAAVLLFLVGVSFSIAQDKQTTLGDVAEHDIVIVELGDDEDSAELRFSEPTTVRVAGSTPVGIGKLSVRVTGDAKLLRKVNASRIIGGRKPIGAAEMEFEIQLGKGQSKVEVTSMVKGAEPTIQAYKFEVR